MPSPVDLNGLRNNKKTSQKEMRKYISLNLGRIVVEVEHNSQS
jgi:hypothetical protein